MTRKHKSRDEVYAVLRADEFHTANTSIEDRVVVKEIVWSEDIAAAEVRRLTAENFDKGSRYWYQITRLFRPGQAAGPDDASA
jgi:hypothetical protein